MKKTFYLGLIIIILILLYEISVNSEPYKLNLPPTLPTYTAKITDTAPNIGGYGYSYTATAYSGLLVQRQGITKPIVDLKIYPQGSATPIAEVTDKDAQFPDVKGLVDLKTYVQSLQGVKNYKIYLYKFDPGKNEYRSVKANNPGDSCRFCQDLNCNLLEEELYSTICTSKNECTFVFSWDSKQCYNQKFMLTSYGYDNYPNGAYGNSNSDTIFFATNNPGRSREPGSEGLFSSELLNTVYLKIKSWIS